MGERAARETDNVEPRARKRQSYEEGVRGPVVAQFAIVRGYIFSYLRLSVMPSIRGSAQVPHPPCVVTEMAPCVHLGQSDSGAQDRAHLQRENSLRGSWAGQSANAARLFLEDRSRLPR